jgi:hypothetical protein
MTFMVLAERCDQCLYGPNHIVRSARRKQLIRDLNRSDGHFICHKASIAGVEVACRGDWDQRGCGQLGRSMERLGAVEFIAEANLGKQETDK